MSNRSFSSYRIYFALLSCVRILFAPIQLLPSSSHRYICYMDKWRLAFHSYHVYVCTIYACARVCMHISRMDVVIHEHKSLNRPDKLSVYARKSNRHARHTQIHECLFFHSINWNVQSPIVSNGGTVATAIAVCSWSIYLKKILHPSNFRLIQYENWVNIVTDRIFAVNASECSAKFKSSEGYSLVKTMLTRMWRELSSVIRFVPK